jgi:cell wall-associated NlpC family hydrolase
MTTKLIFSTKKWEIGSIAIRLFTWSQWSHVALMDGDNHVVEANAFHGVRRITLANFLASSTSHEIVEFSNADSDKVIRSAFTQIGKGYDWLAIFGLFFKRNWGQNSRWICSELIAWAFLDAGFPIFRSTRVHRITQEHLWMLQPVNESPVVDKADTKPNQVK